MDDEQVFLKLFKKNLISFKKLQHGEIVGTGFLNPLMDKFSIFTMLYFQTRFYKKYDNLAKWNGKIVANTFAPPVGSRPRFRGLENLVKSHLFGRAFPLAMTFAVTYRCQCSCVPCSVDKNLRLDRVDNKKTMPILFTNGQFLTDENAERLVDAGKLLKDTSDVLTQEQKEEITEFSSHIFNNKLVKHPAYNHRSQFCRMQHPDFRRFYIDPIPDDAPLPYPIDNLPGVDYRKTMDVH